jgi:hypothetical protein
MKIILTFLICFSLFNSSKATSKIEIPEDVRTILDTLEENNIELEKVINNYQNPEDSLKLKAAYFLIDNMGKHSYATYKLVDSTNETIDFNVLDYPDFNTMVNAVDSIEEIRGEINFKRDTLLKDCHVITSDFLINNIDLAFIVWQEYPWARHLDFDQFCEYVLPYRGSNEPLENWRPYFYEELSWLKDSIKNDDDPIKAAIFINNEIKSWFSFDSRFYYHPTDLGLSEMLEYKMGRCEDMTNLAIYTMRSMGIPVMSDYVPYWPNAGNNHAWNATLDKNGKVVIFMGAEANLLEYKLRNKKSKVYRKTFSIQKNSLAEIKEDWEKAAPYLGGNTFIDVTKDYIPVIDVKLTLEKEVPDSTNYAYICVFNTGEWKAIHWSSIMEQQTVNFTDMGMDIAYLPAYYVDKEIIPAHKQFILTKDGQIIYQEPDTLNTIDLTLFSTTKKVTKHATDEIEEASFEIGKSYELFYWDDKWISLGKQKAKGDPLYFINVPSNVLYWLVAEISRKEERIFTIDNNGKQVWW